MEVWLEEGEVYGQVEMMLHLHVPGTELWFSSISYDYSDLEECRFTSLFWDAVESGKINMTKIGEF